MSLLLGLPVLSSGIQRCANCTDRTWTVTISSTSSPSFSSSEAALWKAETISERKARCSSTCVRGCGVGEREMGLRAASMACWRRVIGLVYSVEDVRWEQEREVVGLLWAL